ncbi:MAG: hypothetical protein ACOYME_12545 [Prochlorotrichaceae cyanobacterium]
MIQFIGLDSLLFQDDRLIQDISPPFGFLRKPEQLTKECSVKRRSPQP